MEYLVSIVVIAVICYVYYLWDVYSYWRTRGIVGPTPWPFVGNYGSVLFRIKTETQVIQKIYKDCSLEKSVGIFIGRHPVLLLRDPQMVKQVLSLDSEKFPDRYISLTMRDYKKSLFLAPGDENWRFLRKTLSPLFNTVHLSQIIPSLKEATENYLNFVEELIKKTNNNNQDIYSLIRDLLEAIVYKAIMGKNVTFGVKSELKTKTAEMLELEEYELKRVLERIFPDIMKTLKPVFLYFGKHYYDFTLNLMSSSLNSRKNYQSSDTITLADLILLVQESKKRDCFDDESMAANFGTMCVTLLESVSTTMAFLAFELAQRPDVQEKCFEEVSQIFKDHNGHVDLDIISKMKYLEMVVDESMRLNAIPYIIDRICSTKYKFPGTDLVIDKGVYVYIPVVSLHRDPEYFAEPEKFIPERFSPDNKAKIPSGAYLPFSDGPRRCIGASLSKLVTMMGMAKFLHKFKLEPSDRTPDKVTLKTSVRVRRIKDGVWVNILRRDVS